MRESLKDTLITIGIILVIVWCIFSAGMILKLLSVDQIESTELTIEHLWEEDNEYYFADISGNVYQLGNYRDVSDKIVYDDMPKQRFGRLNIGSRYEIEYVSGMDYWISISEKEV